MIYAIVRKPKDGDVDSATPEMVEKKPAMAKPEEKKATVMKNNKK